MTFYQWSGEIRVILPDYFVLTLITITPLIKPQLGKMEYSDQILKGGDGMPAFKDKLKQEVINDLVRFIREQIQGNVTAR